MFSVVPSHNSHSSGLRYCCPAQHKNHTHELSDLPILQMGKLRPDTAPSHWDLQLPKAHLKYPQGGLAEWPWSPLEGCRLWDSDPAPVGGGHPTLAGPTLAG